MIHLSSPYISKSIQTSYILLENLPYSTSYFHALNGHVVKWNCKLVAAMETGIFSLNNMQRNMFAVMISHGIWHTELRLVKIEEFDQDAFSISGHNY